MKFLFLSFLMMSNAFAGTKLLLIGGGPRPEEALRAFVQAAGGSQASIVVCSWASKNLDGAKNIQAELLTQHAGSVNILPSFPIKIEDKALLKTMLHSATGIFFAGGDQNQLMAAIQSENLKTTLQTAYQNGVVFGGTSAGTAVMSERMISGDAATPDQAPPLAEGLGILPSEIIVDQHFIARNRFNRLANLVLQNQNTFGLGIDEGTSLFVINSRIARVIGPTQVILFSKSGPRKIDVEYFNENEMFNLFGLKH